MTLGRLSTLAVDSGLRYSPIIPELLWRWYEFIADTVRTNGGKQLLWKHMRLVQLSQRARATLPNCGDRLMPNAVHCRQYGCANDQSAAHIH